MITPVLALVAGLLCSARDLVLVIPEVRRGVGVKVKTQL